MDIFDEEIFSLWESLNSHKVRYIMVGGFATYFNGFERSTSDLDIWLDDTKANRQNLRRCLTALDYPDFAAIETIQFIPGWSSLRLGENIELDIMTDMKGLEDLTFDQCLKQASIADVNGIQIPFLHINQLIANKKAVNRPKDQMDVIELERIKQLRDQNLS